MRTLDPDRESLLDLLDEIRYTVYRLRRSKVTKPLLPEWEALLKEVRAALGSEFDLLDRLLDATAWVDCADGDLDVVVLRVVNTVVKLVGGNRADPLYKRYVGNQTPSELIRPRLGEELSTVEPWVDSLKAAPQKELAEQATGLATVVEDGKLAAAALVTAQQVLEDFRVGPRRALFERCNAERKTLLGELNKLEAADTTRHLARDFVDRHFRQKKRRAAPSETFESARQAVSEAETALAEAQNRLKALEDQVVAEQQAIIQKATDEQGLAEAERQIAEAQARVATLQRRLSGK